MEYIEIIATEPNIARLEKINGRNNSYFKIVVLNKKYEAVIDFLANQSFNLAKNIKSEKDFYFLINDIDKKADYWNNNCFLTIENPLIPNDYFLISTSKQYKNNYNCYITNIRYLNTKDFSIKLVDGVHFEKEFEIINKDYIFFIDVFNTQIFPNTALKIWKK